MRMPPRWKGTSLPGMRWDPAPYFRGTQTWARGTWRPLDSTEFTVEPNLQPCFKLHGSSNWNHVTGSPLLVIGGEKVREINSHPILCWYAEQFEIYLSRPNTRLFVIGYGFRDLHINNVLTRAVTEQGLQMFIVDPRGSGLAQSMNNTRASGQITVVTNLEEMFKQSLIGASRRPLRDIFGKDAIEFGKLENFFSSEVIE